MVLSIIIINYNTYKLTCDCIESIHRTVKVEHEVILVDNNSQERDASDFAVRFPWVKLFSLKENIGFGRANNIGMKEATGQYILLLNSDTVVFDETLDKSIQYLEQNRDIDILGCKVTMPGGVTQRTVFEYEGELSIPGTVRFFLKRNSISREIIKLGYKMKDSLRKKNVTQVSLPGDENMTDEQITPNYYKGRRIGALMGVFLLFRRKVYEETQGFDPDFFMYYEEVEWFIKHCRKYKAVYYPHVSILHYYGQSDVYRKMTLQGHVSQYLFWYKMGYAQFFMYFLYNLVEIPSRILLTIFTFKRKHLSEIPVLVKAFPYALFDIPRYSNDFGSRKEMLKLKSLKRKNL